MRDEACRWTRVRAGVSRDRDYVAEKKVHDWSRAKREALIQGHQHMLPQLSKKMFSRGHGSARGVAVRVSTRRCAAARSADHSASGSVWLLLCHGRVCGRRAGRVPVADRRVDARFIGRSVWRGGSRLAASRRLTQRGVRARRCSPGGEAPPTSEDGPLPRAGCHRPQREAGRGVSRAGLQWRVAVRRPRCFT